MKISLMLMLYVRGMILPGFNMMREALFSRTKIPYTDSVAVSGLPGRNTAECIALASQHSVAALVDRMVPVFGAGASSALLLFTGSGGRMLMGAVELQGSLIPDPVILAMKRVAEEGDPS